MSNSIFLAKLIGPTLLVIGLGMVINGAAYRTMAEEFLRSRALIYIAGLLALRAGAGHRYHPQRLDRRLAHHHHAARLAGPGRGHFPPPVSAGGHAHRLQGHRHPITR